MPAQLLAAYPVLAATDMSRSLAFFEALGFVCRFVDDPDRPRYAVVRRDAAELHLQWMAEVPVTTDGDRPVTRLLVDDVDALFQEQGLAVRQAGASPSGPYAEPANAPWGTREWHLHDPSGNGIQFYQTDGG